ncbi:hypothetical protein ACFV2X_38375 [Streptomyces sp. NPDC059679]|uniref:hypothetical protein n=1 Tax=Streptomyces sp. NPDC059679 TaxID=3346903 RepID=UPI0036C7504A
MATPDFAHYAIQHPDGRWLYHLPGDTQWGQPQRTGVYADGQPMTQLTKDSPWWVTDHQAQRITATYQPNPKTTGYTLKDPDTASVRYPARLTVDEWKARREDATDDEHERLWSLYQSVVEPQDEYEEEIEGSWVPLEGSEPRDSDSLPWIVEIAYGITQRPEYAHCFPGYIDGLRDHLHKLIKHRHGVRHCFDGYQGQPGLHVTLEVPFDKPVTRWQARIGRNGQKLKSGRDVPVTVDRRLVLPVPPRVHGPNYATAQAEWEQQVEFWLGIVEEASVKACNACGGTGHVPDGAEKYGA